MYDTSEIFLLCLFAIVNVACAENSKFFKPGQATDQDVKSLLKITSKQALPAIMFKMKGTDSLDFLIGLREAEVKNGRIASGTKFYSRSSESQIFFCQQSESQTGDNCLAPKQFKKSQPLECDIEPVPILIDPGEEPCGVAGKGTHLKFSYSICPAEQPYSYNISRNNAYTICYDKKSNRMLSVGYTSAAAGLLREKLFDREREIKFDMNRETYELIDANYYANLEAEIKQKPMYKLQMLVPIDDMALAIDRKTTRFFANYALQHGALTDLWDDITGLFRNHTINWKDTPYERITGIVDIPEDELIFTQVDQSQKANIWITLMVDPSATPFVKGLAVVMHNFITDDSKNQTDDIETSKKQYIDKLCGKNLCVEELKKKFKKVGTQGRCCEITRGIYNTLMREEEIWSPVEVLLVENITYT